MTAVLREELLRREALLKELAWAKKYRALDFYKPYPKQLAFHAAEKDYNQIFFMAANRCGKSFCGSRALGYHLTGQYPDWWPGRRFTRPIEAWAANDTALMTRDVTQANLVGKWSDVALRGSGAIPKEAVDWTKDVTMSRFMTDGIDTVNVEHRTNGRVDGKSTLTMKAYKQGRETWQGKAVDVIWLDEEPDDDVYEEAMARLTPVRRGDKRGLMLITATPLLALSKTREKFIYDASPEQTIVRMTLYDAEHIDAEEIEKTVASYPPHERPARIMGVPMAGDSMVFDVTEDKLRTEAFEIPKHWSLLWGIDFGINHPFAAVLIAWDKDADVIYVTRTVRMKDTLPVDHAEAMKPYGADIPVAWPQDGAQRREFEGTLTQMAKIYKAHGLKMQDTHAKFPDGSNSTEAGIMEMRERMRTGRFKVFSYLNDWFEEYRSYHRKDGQIVKKRDDLMSATRVAVMAKRGARIRERYLSRPNGGGVQIAQGVDTDAWGA